MAISPVPIYEATAGNIKVTAEKAKSLVVRTNSVSNFNDGRSAKAHKAQDLAERLNEETRQNYVKDNKVGEGTYANVYRGHLKADPLTKVAIKKIKLIQEYRDGLTMDSIREVKYLQELSHPNVIALHAVFSSKNQNLNLVLEYLPLGDLEMLIKDTQGIRYGTAEIKTWMGMLGRGVWFCHESFVLHRDIKPNNLLIAADGEVKLADFGLARSFADPYMRMTYNVITRWYRPPELLLQARHYSGVVDVWSMGMVFAELILRVPFLPGDSELDQFRKICQNIGTPTEDNWPGVSRLLEDATGIAIDRTAIVPVSCKDHFLAKFGTAGHVGVDLLMSMLTLDPQKRCTARQVLEHRWWTSDPRPTAKEDLPKKGGGLEKMGDDLRRRGGEIDDGEGNKVARKLNFGAAK